MRSRFLLLFAVALASGTLRAWDYHGHRIINQVALASLPPEFPAFARAPEAAERIAFLSGEPDRWRNVADLPIRHANGLDHYFDLEQVSAAGLDLATLTAFRYDFVTAFAAGREAHREKFPPIDPANNADRTREWPGFAPWAVVEYYGRLKSAFLYLRACEENGAPEEIANARANVIHIMGVMGHFVGDLAQPLHTTVHHHGWVGDNPRGYTRWSGLHAWIDGGLIAKTGITADEIRSRGRPARRLSTAARDDGRDPIFAHVMKYLIAQHARVEPLYRLEKAGKLGTQAEALSEARAFVSEQLRAGGEMLGALWLTAWQDTVPGAHIRSPSPKRPQEKREAP